jgi:hypothetical protein
MAAVVGNAAQVEEAVLPDGGPAQAGGIEKHATGEGIVEVAVLVPVGLVVADGLTAAVDLAAVALGLDDDTGDRGGRACALLPPHQAQQAVRDCDVRKG